MKPLYRFKKVQGEYFVYREDDPEPFDGPMTKDEAEILTDNLNETPEPDENDPDPIIRDLVGFNTRLREELDPIPVETE